MRAPDGLAAIDRMMGRNIGAHRLMRQLTERQLADRNGVSFRQLQKCERGVNRISPSRLTVF